MRREFSVFRLKIVFKERVRNLVVCNIISIICFYFISLNIYSSQSSEQLIFDNENLIFTKSFFIFEKMIFFKAFETSLFFAKTFHDVRRQTNCTITITISRTTKVNTVLLIEFKIFNATETTDSSNFRNENRCFVDFVLIHFFDIFINVSTVFYELVSNLDILEISHSITHCRCDFLFEFIDFNVIVYFQKNSQKIETNHELVKNFVLVFEIHEKIDIKQLACFLENFISFLENLFKIFEHFIENDIKINVINLNTINDNVICYVLEMFANVIDFVLFDKILTCVDSKLD